MSSPCSACTKRCCANYTVSVNGYDAWLIGTRLRLPLESFLVYFVVGEEAERGFRLDAGGPRHEIALDKVGGFARGNPCVFWIDLMNGRGRCGIYAVRPHVCQTYPAYQQADVVMLRDDVLCPEGSWSLGGLDLPLFRRRTYAFRVEQDVYAAVVAAWNDQVERDARGRRIEDFYAHLMNAYDRLERLRSSFSPPVAARLLEAWGGREPTAPSPLVVDLGFPEVEEASGMLARIREAVDWVCEPASFLAASA
jgi:Fe-S-cluster containining protein